MATKKSDSSVTRRRFMRDVSYGAGTAVTVAFLFGLPAKQSQASTVQCLLPPGALKGDAFAAACIRCGQCVQACPHHTLRLATVSTGIAVGTPYFIARETPCELCETIHCVQACPSGALDPDLTDIYQSRMGLAVLLDQESCVAWQGLRCEVCYVVCPLAGEAITLEKQVNTRTGVHTQYIPTVHSNACTGCGKCEEACILDQAAIKVLPLDVAKGELGKHYRLGWREKENAGGPLVPSTEPMEIRLPEKEGGI